jgi:hypothetical protein
MLLVEALVHLFNDKPLEGQLGLGKWLEYRVSDDGTKVLRQGEPVRLEDLLEIEWRVPEKSPDTWVKEAKALLEMGAKTVDAPTLAGVLAKVSELETQVNEVFERSKKEATQKCIDYVWDLLLKDRMGLVPKEVCLDAILHTLTLDLKYLEQYKPEAEWNKRYNKGGGK